MSEEKSPEPKKTLASRIDNMLSSIRQNPDGNEKIGINVLDAFPTSIKIKFGQLTSSTFFMTACFVIFALCFGFAFFYTNIRINGHTSETLFVGYCVWAWITILCVILILRQLGKYAAIFWKTK